MIVLVTGATGFVGRWLVGELQQAGHDPVSAPPSTVLSITDTDGIARLLRDTTPDAIAHLAGVSYGPDAARDVERAFAVNVGGTDALMAAIAANGRRIPVLVAGSSEVYGHPRPEDLPLTEAAPLRAEKPYGMSKLAQEQHALAAGERMSVPVFVARSFNHTGPGQRPVFVAPALAARVLEARASGSRSIRTGNVDVRRDVGDVRDVVRAYRRLLEALVRGDVSSGVANIATGRGVAIREILAILCELAGIHVEPFCDPSLVRPDDPPEIVGNPSRLNDLTGWTAEIPLETTLADLFASLGAGRAAFGPG